MIILGVDIAYLAGYIYVDYNPATKKVEILESGLINVKNKKSHKDYHLRIESEKLLAKKKPDIVIYEEQFQNLMFRVEGAFAAGIPDSVKIEKVFSKRARKLAFNDGGLSKEEAAEKIEILFPELKGKAPDILDAMVLVLALISAIENNEPLKLPKKPKKKKKSES